MAKSKAKPKNDLIIPKDFPISLRPITEDCPPDMRTISVIIEGSSPYIANNFTRCGCCH
jgi:hypothetical protein